MYRQLIHSTGSLFAGDKYVRKRNSPTLVMVMLYSAGSLLEYSRRSLVVSWWRSMPGLQRSNQTINLVELGQPIGDNVSTYYD